MRDDAADWADEKPLRHRCHYSVADHCRICSYLPEEDEDACPKCSNDGTDCYYCATVAKEAA